MDSARLGKTIETMNININWCDQLHVQSLMEPSKPPESMVEREPPLSKLLLELIFPMQEEICIWKNTEKEYTELLYLLTNKFQPIFMVL